MYGVKCMPNQGLELVNTRNNFYRKNYHSAVINFLLLFSTIIALAIFVIFKHITTVYTLYFPTTPSGEYIKMPPLDVNHLMITNESFNPDGTLKDYPLINISDLGENINPETAIIEYWAKNAIVHLHDYDYVNYRQALQDIRDYFTLRGHDSFLEALRFSRNLEAVKLNFQVLSADISGPLTIDAGKIGAKISFLKKAWYFIIRKKTPQIFAWFIKIPITVTYENISSDPLQQRLIANMLVVRETTLRSPFFGLAIDQIYFTSPAS